MIAITGGGTGGHLRIAQLIKKELASQGINPLFIGSTGGQDRSWFEGDRDFCATLFLQSRGVMNKGLLGKLVQLANVFILAVKLGKTFRTHGITKVFSVGGYSAAPAVFAAIIFRKELYIHEQNAKTGALNRLTRPFCKQFFSSFDTDSPCHNYPVDASFYETRRVRNETRQLLFMGGSLGAKAINELAMASAETITKMGIRIVHLTGEKDFDRVAAFYGEKQLPVTVKSFEKEIVPLISTSDFAVARAGASSLFELYANALPTLFIPYPYAASDHQFYNAANLAENGLAFCKRETEMTRDYLIALLEQNHTMMSQKLFDSFENDGIGCIVKHLVSKHS